MKVVKTSEWADQLAKRMTRTLRDEFGQPVKLHMCRKAVAAGLGVAHDGLIRQAEYPRTWNGRKAADRLVQVAPEVDRDLAATAILGAERRLPEEVKVPF